MKNIIRIFLALFGILIIISSIKGGVGSGRSSVSFFLSIILGGGLILVPFTAFGMLLYYLIMLTVIIGFPILGALLMVEIAGKDSFLIIIGIVGGLIIGVKLGCSNFFDKLLNPVRKLSQFDDDK